MHNDVQYKMLQYTFFWKDNGNGDESERTAIGGMEEKETKEEDVFSGRAARTMAYIYGRVEKGPPWLPASWNASPQPPPSATGAASSYMQNKYPLFS